MSAPTISQSYRDQFSDDVRLYFQQMGSLLKSRVMVDPLAAQNGYFEYIKPVTATQRTERAAEVNITPVEHERRKFTQTTWEANDYVDKFEQKITVPNLSQHYARNFAMALGRKQDQLILNAAVGTAYGGRKGETSIAFDTTNQRVAVDYVESGSATASNITLAKLRKLIQKLTGANALLPNDGTAAINVAYGSSQLLSLLAICETLKVTGTTTDSLASGKPNTIFYGMNFIRVDDAILPKTGNNRSVIAWVNEAIQYGDTSDISVAIDWVPTRKSWLVATDFQGDAARVRDTGVVEVLCDETKV